MNPVKPTVREIFTQALEVETSEERLAFLEHACHGDAQVRRKVEDLLAAHTAAGKFMNGTGMAPATLDMPLSVEGPGDYIGPYKLREQIGEGGFGVVFVAEQAQPVCRKVALKIIKPGMDTKDVVARFEAERQALALMNHPNVAKVFDAGSTESGRPYFVMELVHGIPITEFCDELKLSNRERLELFTDVCRAVQHAHQKGIIHRDLKPANIMVTMHDDKPVPKVIDFGVAKALSQKLTEKTVYTSYSQMVGTPLYMSPEQAQMNGLDVDTRSDVYSLGVLLYELLTGATPFDRETLKNAGFDELRRIIREDDPPCPSARVSTLNAHLLSTASDRRKIDQRKLSQSLRGELDWIVMKALEKDRGRRYETASKLAEDVQNYLHDAPVEACPPSFAYKFRKFARRNSMVLTTSALVALALIVGTIGSASQAVRAYAAEAEADEQRGAAILTAERAEKNERAAQQERDAAVAAREKLRRVLYASEMNLIQPAWDYQNYRRVAQLLESTRPQSDETDVRGFEWHYWRRQLRGPLQTQSVDIPRGGTRRLLEETLSPDGSKVAVQYYEEGQIYVAMWDVATAREVCNFRLSTGTIGLPRTVMVFSPDGTRLAIATRQTGNLRIWDTRTGEQLFQRDDENNIFRIFFTHDGNRVLYTAGTRGKKRSPSDFGYQVWDLQTGDTLFSHRYEGETYPNLLFLSPDGKQVGVSREATDGTGTLLQIWDVETAKVLQSRLFDDGFIYRVLSPDGNRLLLQHKSAPDQIPILETQSLRTVSVLQGEPCHTAAFSPDGRLLATSKDTRSISLWNLQNPSDSDALEPTLITSPLFTLPVFRPSAELRFSSDSRQLRSCILSRVTSWNIPSELKAGERAPWSHGGVLGGSFNKEASRALLRADPLAFDHQVALLLNWDIDMDRELWRYRDPREDRAFGNPIFSTDDRYIVVPSCKARKNRAEKSAANHDELLVLDGKTGGFLRTLKPQRASNVDNMVFAPEHPHVAAIVTRRADGKPVSFEVVQWNVESGEEVFAAVIEDENPNLVGFSSNGEELMVAQRGSGGVLVLDASTGVRRRIIAPERTVLNQFGKWSLSPDGRTLAVLGLAGHYNDIAVTLYDAKTGELGLRIPVDSEYPPLAMTWTSDSRRLALVSAQWVSTDVTLWDTETGRLVLTLSRKGLMGQNQRSLRFSPDNHRLLHIADDNRIERGEAWDNPSTHPIHIWDGTPLKGSDPAYKDADQK